MALNHQEMVKIKGELPRYNCIMKRMIINFRKVANRSINLLVIILNNNISKRWLNCSILYLKTLTMQNHENLLA